MVLNGKLAKGDWIVHANYGLGQVKGEDKKMLAGEEKEYYKVKTRTATYWLPKNRVNADTIREVASEKRFEQALAEFKAEPEVMAKDFRTRRAKIAEIISTNSIVAFASLIRDLYYRRKQKNLNQNEKNALELLKTRFAREWSVAHGIEESEALSRLEKTLTAAIPNP
ncbi:MAG: CarD family transcriptional regulator [Anaerolineales bacterium]|jgi:RNA polymerase-interacting CarD/CdnL/TRCF family regulator